MFDFLKKAHVHPKIPIFPNDSHWTISIDKAVRQIWENQATLNKELNAIKSELDAIHAHYRAELCEDCCHLGVCAVSPSVKYGYKCEDKAEPVKVNLTFIELPEIKDPPATANSKESQD